MPKNRSGVPIRTPKNRNESLKMRKEGIFLVYCMERYRFFNGLSGFEVASLFELYGVSGYIIRHFESLHTMGDRYIVQDIDSYIQARAS